MKGIKSKVITTWRNYAIDKDKARYTKVGGRVIDTDLIRFKGLEPGKKYTISAQVRLNIQQTDTNIFFEVHQGQNWLGVNRKDFAGMGDMSLNGNITITPPAGADENTVYGLYSSCFSTVWSYVPHDGDYYIVENFMVNEGDKPLPYIDPDS